MHFCPNMTLLRDLPEFQNVREYYADRHYSDHHLAIALQLFREKHSDKYTDDWFPENSRDKAVFTRFLNHELKKAKLAQTTATMGRDEISNIYSTLYSLYTPEQLSNRLKMIANDFRKEVDALEDADKTGRSRQDLIKAQGKGDKNGFVRILERVFGKYGVKYASVEHLMDVFDKKEPDASPERREKAQKRAEYVYQEFQTLLLNKDRLAALAAIRIGENEGFAVNVQNFEISIDELTEEDLNEPMDTQGQMNDGTDSEEGVKGERYTDYRVLKLMNTLGPRAKRMLSRIAKTDSRGKVQKDDLGMVQFLDSRQAAIALTRAIMNSRPETMMDDLRAAADYNPWMVGLINELEQNPQMQTTVYCNFKKAATIYVYTNLDDGAYTPKVANTRSSGHAMMRDAGSNLQAGYVLNEPTSVYTETGYLKSLPVIKEIRRKFDELKTKVIDGTKNIRMVDGDKRPKNPVHDYEKLAPIDAMREFLKQNPGVTQDVSDALRGLGYSVTPNDIETIALQTMNPKGYRFVAGWGNTKNLNGRNKLYHLVKWMDSALAQAEWVAENGEVKTGQYFYNTATDEYRMMDNCLALAKYDEVEPRVNNDGKSMSTFNNTNLLHQVTDILLNAEGQDEEAYKRTLEQEYLQYEGMSLGKGENRQNVGWLKYFYDNKFRQTEMRKAFRLYTASGFNHVEYARLTREQKLTNAAVQFFGASKMFSRGSDPFCGIEFPIQSDYSTAYDFMYVPRLKVGQLLDESTGEYGFQSELVEALADEVLVELERIQVIEERVNADPEGKNRPKLSVYEREGMKFQIFPAFNSNGFRQEYTEYKNPAEARKFVKQRIAEQLIGIREQDIKLVEDSGILKNYNLRSYGLYSKDGKVSSLSEANQKKLDDWFFNTFYARLQMVKIWDGGLHNFDGLIDFEKRNMLEHATHTSLYTKAMWNGKQVGKESQNVVYVADEVSQSAFLKDIMGMLKDLLDEGLISKVQYKGMKKAYSKIKSTDGQGVRTLESYREVMIMTDQWDQRHEDAYNRIQAGNPTKGDIDVFMQPIKPVATGFEHIDAVDGENQKPVKLTFLHKYSEIVLLPVALAKTCLSAQSVPFRAFDMAQKELGNVDMFLFHSGAKVGAHSIISPFARNEKTGEHILKDSESIKNYIVSSVKGNKWAIHKIPYKYYGIAASTPPHGIDDRISRASQKEKTVWANIQSGDKVVVNGKEMSAIEARNLYYKIKSATIIEQYQKLREMFDNTDELERVFQEELASKSYQPQELKFVLSHLKNGKFALPLFSPNVEHQVQELLASIIKKRLTKVKTKGANVIVSTALGMEVDISPYSDADGFPDEFKLGLEFEGEGKDKRLKWMDVGLPMPEKLEEFADKDGNITPTMLWGRDGTGETEGLVHDGVIPLEALMGDASRTPSDAEHSTFVFRVKWFSRRLEGGNGKAAKEAMVTTGQDFDGDKLRMDFPEYDVVWNEEKLESDYDKILGLGTEAGAANLILGNIRSKETNEALKGYKSWRRWAISDSNPDRKKYRKVQMVEYDDKKSPLENNARARHNMMMALTRGQLTSPAGSRRALIPGGCEESKIYAKTLHLVRLAINDTVKNQLFKAMTDDKNIGGLGMSAEDAAKALRNAVTMYEAFTNMDDGELTTLIKAVGSTETPYTLTHSVEAFEYLMGGAEMIGIYALYNSAQQMMQRLDMHYIPFTTTYGKQLEVSIFGHKIDKLFDVKNKKGNLASLGLARLLNAAVDNGKDPILGYLNQTKEMAEMTSFLFAAGVDEEQVHLIMNQPAVIELINRLKGRDSEGMEKEIDKLVDEMQTQYKEARLKYSAGLELVSKMSRDDFVSALPNSFESYTNSEDIGAVNMQTAVLYFLDQLYPAASQLAEFTRLTRPESNSGAIGSTIASITGKVIALTKFRNMWEKIKDNPNPNAIRISGMEEVIYKRDIGDGTDAQYMAELFGNELPEVVALNTLMMDSTLDMFKPFFPQARQDWINTIMEVASLYQYKTPQDGVIERIGQEMILWKLLSDKRFVQGDTQEEQRRIIVDVPKQLHDLKDRIEKAKQNKDKKVDENGNPVKHDTAAEALIGNTFLEKLTTTSPENSRVNPRISFSLNGPAVEGTADSIRAYWGELLNSDDEGIRNLAIDLFKYNMYTNGFGYGMYEFAHFAPFSVILQTPGFIDAMERVLDSTWSDGFDKENFINQYIMNHWGDKKFLQFIPESKVPNDIRQMLGWNVLLTEKQNEKAWKFGDELPRYIVVTKGRGKNQKQTLYRLSHNAPGYDYSLAIGEAVKLGVRLRNNQVMYQFNPSVDFRFITPVVPGNDSAWGVVDRDVEENAYAESNYSEDPADPNYHSYVDSLGSIRPKEKKTEKDLGKGFFGVSQKQKEVEKLDEKAAEAVKKNGEIPEQAPMPTVEDMPVEEEPENTDITTNLGRGFFGIGNKMLSIASVDENGEVVTHEVPASPDNIRKARRQQTFVLLNQKLRDILKEHGVGIGALSEFEARLSLAGVTDFDTAEVAANGLVEMIRIAEGYLGEEALPEEFAHLAIEMIGHDNPLVARLLSVLNSNDDALREAFEDQYDEYVTAYQDDRDKMILEAAGKLVAKQLFRQQEIETRPIKRLLTRVVDAIKSFLRLFRREEVQNAIFDANRIASKLAREMLGGRILDDRTLNDINATGELYAKTKEIKKDLTGKSDILHKLLKTETKRLFIFRNRIGYDAERAKKSKSIQATEAQIKKLEKAIENYKTEDAIITYMGDSFDFLENTYDSLKKAVDSGQPANKICKRLNLTRDTLYSFSKVMEDVRQAIIDGEVQDSVELTSAISKTADALEKFFRYYNIIAMRYFEEMLTNVYGEHGITVDIGKDKGRNITIKEMARRADGDISLASRWFHAIADCNDYVLKAIDDVTRDAKYNARRHALEIKPLVEKAVADLKKETGSVDQSFMFEMKKFDGKKWCNGKQDDGKLHKTGKYISVEASRKLSPAQKKFYDAMMDIKKKADKYMPETLLEDDKIVMLRKYTWDRVKESDGIKNKTLEVWEGIRNSVLDTSDSIDYDNYEVRVDFEGNRVDMLPVHYLAKGKNELYDDMVDDVATSIMAYAGMAFEYGELNSVIGILENAKYMASQRDVIQKTGNKTQRESIETDDVVFREPFTKKQARTNIEAALEDFFQMHIYGHIQANEGTIGNTRISKRKAVDFINGMTSLSQMAINIPQRIANVSTGMTQILLESVGKGVFTARDTAWASKIYMKESGDRLAETGKTDYDNKLSLWRDKFDVQQDNGRSYKSTKYKQSRAGRVFNSSLLYAGLTMGEDYLSTTTALAVARNFKMKGPNGEDSNLWEAYEVKYTDPANKTGAYLELKKGYKKADGSELTVQDERKFAKAVAGLNFELQGIYNLDDRSAVQQYALGALLIMYRKWIAPSLKRRYAGVQYNALKGSHEEGYHRTLFRLLRDSVVDAKNQVTEEEGAKALLNIIADMKALKTSILMNWNKLTDYEKSNVQRAMTELGVVAGLYMSCALLGKIPPQEMYEEDTSGMLKWWDQTVMSQMLRLRTEIGAMAPTPMFVDEAMHILKSPFAAIGPLQNTINAFELVIPSNYMVEIKSGRYRGHKKAYKYFRELPVISMFKKVDNFIDPSPLINYYKNDAQY